MTLSKLLTETLRALKGKRTVIVVSHRIEPVKHCDVICVLDGGVVREAGKHGELIQSDGFYARLARGGGRAGAVSPLAGAATAAGSADRLGS